MGTFIKTFLLAGISAIALFSCKKDEVKTVLAAGAVPALTASTTALNLTQARADSTAVTVNWTGADYGFTAAVTYALQLSKKGTNFASASTTEIALATGTTKSRTFTVNEIDKELLKVIPANAAGEIEARIKADVASSVVSVYSNVLTLTATPYRALINYPSIYVPGDYQGWDPGKAPKLSSVANNKMYEGYINMVASSLEFKLTSDPDWNHTAYGDAGAGKLSTSGGNIKAPSVGYYWVKADLTALTWSVTKTTWAMIGEATPGGWGAETQLTYNAAAGVWSATVNLTAGEMKFRANGAYDINYGDNNADNIPDFNGSNIKVAVAGNYTVSLDLSVGGNYFYTLKKN